MIAIKNLVSAILLDLVAAVLIIGAAIAALCVLIVSTPINYWLEHVSKKKSTLCKECFRSSEGLNFVFSRSAGVHTCSSCGKNYTVPETA